MAYQNEVSPFYYSKLRLIPVVSSSLCLFVIWIDEASRANALLHIDYRVRPANIGRRVLWYYSGLSFFYSASKCFSHLKSFYFWSLWFDTCFVQVAGAYGLPPTPARRALFIVYQTALPYIAERIRSWLSTCVFLCLGLLILDWCVAVFDFVLLVLELLTVACSLLIPSLMRFTASVLWWAMMCSLPPSAVWRLPPHPRGLDQLSENWSRN